MKFGKICDIRLNDSSSWEKSVFLTFDIDWCSDFVLSSTLDLIENYDISATFFVTHHTTLLERMRENPKIELGIHPNFNPLLEGDFRYGKNAREVVEYYMNIVPDAVSVRSHSMTQNSRLLDIFSEFDLKYDCNHFIPYNSGIVLRPWRHWNNKLLKVPYFWEDDVHCLYKDKWDRAKIINVNGLKVFDFHPIHIYLNTFDLENYKKSKAYMNDSTSLKKYVSEKSLGSRMILEDLIKG